MSGLDWSVGAAAAALVVGGLNAFVIGLGCLAVALGWAALAGGAAHGLAGGDFLPLPCAACEALTPDWTACGCGAALCPRPLCAKIHAAECSRAVLPVEVLR